MLKKLWDDLVAAFTGGETKAEQALKAIVGELKARVEALEAHADANADSLPYKLEKPAAPAEPAVGSQSDRSTLDAPVMADTAGTDAAGSTAASGDAAGKAEG